MSSNLNSRIVDLVAPAARRDHGNNGWPQGEPGKPVKTDRFSNSRRRLLLAMSGATLGLPAFAMSDPMAGLKRWGNGEFRRFGFLVYEATLWAGDDPQRPPLALRLDYKRNLSGLAIAEASVKEMRPMGGDEASLKRWGEQMAKIFPDVKAGDHIIGHYRPEGAAFSYNGRPAGEILEPEFARRFFGIWLDPRTSAPDLRTLLLKRPVA
jgi:hypothetical protein